MRAATILDSLGLVDSRNVAGAGNTAWPDSTNTGVPAGTTLTNSGGLTITTAGTVIDALNISGVVTIAANNVTVKRSRVTGSDFSVIRINDFITGALIEDVEVNGLGAVENQMGVNGPATVRRCNIYGVENGVQPGDGSVIVDSFIHDLAAPGVPHYDGIQIDAGVGITIDHNHIICPSDQTAAVMINNYFGPATNITVNNNKLYGGGYTLYSDGQFAGGPVTGVRVTNNRFGTHAFGYALIRNNTLAASSGNVDDITGAALTIP